MVMVEVDGRIYTTINISVETAIKVLFEDSAYSITKDIDKETSNIYQALLSLKKYYSSVIDKDTMLEVSCNFDTASHQFLVGGEQALHALYKKFTKGSYQLCISEHTDKKEKGVYSYYDVSPHGSPSYVYDLLYKGSGAEETLKALNILNTLYHDFNYKSAKENSKVLK